MTLNKNNINGSHEYFLQRDLIVAALAEWIWTRHADLKRLKGFCCCHSSVESWWPFSSVIASLVINYVVWSSTPFFNLSCLLTVVVPACKRKQTALGNRTSAEFTDKDGQTADRWDSVTSWAPCPPHLKLLFWGGPFIVLFFFSI